MTPSGASCDLRPQHGRRRLPLVTYVWAGTPCSALERGKSITRDRRMKEKVDEKGVKEGLTIKKKAGD